MTPNLRTAPPAEGQCPQSEQDVVSFRQLPEAGAQPDRPPGRFRAEGQSTRKSARPAPPLPQGPVAARLGLPPPGGTHTACLGLRPRGTTTQISCAKGPRSSRGACAWPRGPEPPGPAPSQATPLQPRPPPFPAVCARAYERGAHARSCQSGRAAAAEWPAVAVGTPGPFELQFPPLAVPLPTQRTTPGRPRGPSRRPGRSCAGTRERRRRPEMSQTAMSETYGTGRGRGSPPRRSAPRVPGALSPRPPLRVLSGESDLGVREAVAAGSVCGFVPARDVRGWATPVLGARALLAWLSRPRRGHEEGASAGAPGPRPRAPRLRRCPAAAGPCAGVTCADRRHLGAEPAFTSVSPIRAHLAGARRCFFE